MTEENTLVAEPTEVIPADSKSLRKAQERLERPVADRAAGLAQANEQLRHEIKERRHAEELLLKEQRYLRYLLELQDRDRRMVSCEIHDGLLQQLAAAMMQFRMFSQVTGPEAKKDWKTFESGLEMLNESILEARRLLNGLRSPILDELGVVAAIEDLISRGSNQDEPEIDFVHHLDRERLASSLENIIFRIVQESLTNARRYSQSDRLLVRLTQRDDYIRIEVQDWGIGFDPGTVGDGHFGLQGIQERTRLFGGSTTIKSALGKGTRIVVQLPLMTDVDTAIGQYDNASPILEGGNEANKTSEADVEPTAKVMMWQEKVCPLCNEEHGSHEECEAVKNSRKRDRTTAQLTRGTNHEQDHETQRIL